MNLDEAAYQVMSKSMFVKSGERVLIVYDKNKIAIAEALFNAAKELTHDVSIVKTPVGRISGEKPPDEVAQKMLNKDVILIVTSKNSDGAERQYLACTA